MQAVLTSEIAVYTEKGGNNIISPKTTVTKSSGYQGDKGPTANFVDGKLTTFMHTSCNDAAWVLVDLGMMTPIYKIVINNRPDCCYLRVNGLVLTILDDQQKTIYTANPIADKSGSTKNSESTNQSLAYDTFTCFPPNPKVLGDYTKDTM